MTTPGPGKRPWNERYLTGNDVIDGLLIGVLGASFVLGLVVEVLLPLAKEVAP